jgi:hypothetical protein
MRERKYLILNRTAGFIGNSPLWWAQKNSGYTPRLDKAKRFTAEEAKRVIAGCRLARRS